MYLSVTPHIHPTHTGRTETDEKKPPYFAPNANYHVEQDMSAPMASLLADLARAAKAILEAAQQNLATQQAMAEKMLDALNRGDQAAAVEARNAMWEAVYQLHKKVYSFDDIWNETTPRVGEVAS
jgi:hypothetical protein